MKRKLVFIFVSVFVCAAFADTSCAGCCPGDCCPKAPAANSANSPKIPMPLDTSQKPTNEVETSLQEPNKPLVEDNLKQKLDSTGSSVQENSQARPTSPSKIKVQH